MEVGHVVHHSVVEVAPSIRHTHLLEEGVVGLEDEHAELGLPAGELVDDEVASLRGDALRVRLKLVLVDLAKTWVSKGGNLGV